MSTEIAYRDTVRLMSGTANPELLPLIGQTGIVVGGFSSRHGKVHLVQFGQREPSALLPRQLQLVAKAPPLSDQNNRRASDSAGKHRGHPWGRRRQKRHASGSTK